ncbi:MAG TPA: SRPBCC domain-containing protein [Dermatophilaceae bacterium]|nr:SRPBCC domain-containing protein [Dermatophilaceae bacterium]
MAADEAGEQDTEQRGQVDLRHGHDATVEVTTTLPHPVEQVWQALITRAGSEALLGAGATLGGKGEPWRADHGPHGVLRSYHPLEQIRLTWHADDDAPSSLVDLQLHPQGASTRVNLSHQHVPSDDTERLQRRWTEALERVSGTAG